MSLFKIVCILLMVFMAWFSLPLQAAITLNLLTWEGYSPKNQVVRFKKKMREKYAEEVDLNITYANSTDDFFAKIRSNSVDIIVPSHNILKDERYKLIKQGLIIPITLSKITNYSKLIPGLQKADYTTVNGEIYSVPLAHGPYGLAYNTELVSSAPDSWIAFWDPKFAGRYSLSSDYTEVNIYITALALGFEAEDVADLKMVSLPSVKNALITLIKNANNFWQGVDTADVMESSMLGTSWGFSFPELARRGQAWKMAETKEGTTGWIDGHAISRTLVDKPLHKRIAEEWIDFTLSDQFQIEVIVRGIGSDPVNISIKDQLTEEEVTKFHLNDPDYFKNNRILWPILTIRQRNFLRLLWRDALRASKL